MRQLRLQLTGKNQPTRWVLAWQASRFRVRSRLASVPGPAKHALHASWGKSAKPGFCVARFACGWAGFAEPP
jgi:hypothetical protein